MIESEIHAEGNDDLPYITTTYTSSSSPEIQKGGREELCLPVKNMTSNKETLIVHVLLPRNYQEVRTHGEWSLELRDPVPSRTSNCY